MPGSTKPSAAARQRAGLLCRPDWNATGASYQSAMPPGSSLPNCVGATCYWNNANMRHSDTWCWGSSSPDSS